MKRLIRFGLIMLMTLAVVIPAAAQKVYLCSDYTSTGEPIGEGTVWNIKSTGGFVYVLYDNGSSFSGNKVWLYVDKFNGTDYIPFDTKELSPERGKNYIAYKFTFTEAGQYKFSISSAGSVLAKEYATVKIKDESSSNTYSSTTSGITDITYYYGSTVTFCEDVQNGEAVNPSTVFNISPNGSYLQVLVKHNKKLGTSGLVVDVYKKSGGDYKFFETKNYDISPDLFGTFFKYTFYEAGDYRFYIYNKEQTRINEGYVTIKYR